MIVFISGSEDRILHNEPHRDLPATDLRRVSNISSLKAVGKKKTAGKKLQVCSVTLFCYCLYSLTYLKCNHEHKNLQISYKDLGWLVCR